MASAARPAVEAVELELLRGEADVAGVVVEPLGAGDELVPRLARVDVDLDHARVGGHAQRAQTVVARERVALDHDGEPEFGSGVLEHADQLDGVVGARDRRQEDPRVAVADLDAERGDRWGLGRQRSRRRTEQGLHDRFGDRVQAARERRADGEAGRFGIRQGREPGQ
ncbi:MAG: hypothetical protein PGN13_15260 [Patulibacter minatonensis]